MRLSPLPFLALLAVPVWSQAPEAAARIREEGLSRSQVMDNIQELCDGIGPRLTASPGYKAAAEWVLRRAQDYGLANGHLEAWDFGHPGWSSQRSSVIALAPFEGRLQAEVLAWTPSTKGTVKAETVALKLPEEPTPEELDATLQAFKGKAKGRIVLVGPHKVAPVLPTGTRPLRLEEAELLKRFEPGKPLPPGGPSRPGPKRPGALEPKELDKRVAAFLKAEGALVQVNDAGLRNGQIRAFQNRFYDPAQVCPTLVMRGDDFGRLWRLMERKRPVRLEVEVRNQDHPKLTQGLNVVAELPGTERPGEVVILGAHLDSWHTATGATDDGASAMVMLEALRILKASGLQPKRTVRMVLFDGEEQGLLGSKAYVERHFGTAEAPKPEFEGLVAYVNMDAGAGQIRGLSVFGPEGAAVQLREALAPFKDLGVVGAASHRNRPAKPDFADITSFSHAGLPAIGLTQDPLEYFDYTWHTTLDTVERVPPQDVQRTATVLAHVAYQLATRPERLPHFSPAELPVLTGPSSGK